VTTTTERMIKDQPVHLSLGRITLEGDLSIPSDAGGLVLFAHGSGSSRLSSRNRFVARYLQNRGMATLLFDLLTREEEEINHYNMKLRFDIDLLADRLSRATDWIVGRKEARDLG
jgi:putative phosphoribosyl transferase